jgi:hypothetical protein
MCLRSGYHDGYSVVTSTPIARVYPAVYQRYREWYTYFGLIEYRN